METGPETPDEPTLKKGEKAAEQIKQAYRWWDNLATLNVEDPLWLGATKILIRVIGILILLAISPFAILGIIIGFLAVA